LQFQERIDGWYGERLSHLMYVLERDNDKMRIDSSSTGRVSITMWDYRGVPCEYVAGKGVYITHRIDHYSRKEYKKRISYIENEWKSRKDYYVLSNKVIAIFNKKKKSITFAPVEYLEELSISSNNPQDVNIRAL